MKKEFDISDVFINYESVDFFRYMPQNLTDLPRKISMEYRQSIVIRIASKYIDNPICEVYGKWEVQQQYNNNTRGNNTNDKQASGRSGVIRGDEGEEQYKISLNVDRKLKGDIENILKIVAFAEHELLMGAPELQNAIIHVRFGKKDKAINNYGTIGYWHRLIFPF